MENKDTSKTKVVHTFSDDLVEALGKSQGASLRQMIESEELREKEKEALSPHTPQNRVFIAVSALLILLSFSGLVYVFLNQSSVNEWKYENNNVNPLIFVDRTSFVSLDGLDNQKVVSAFRQAFVSAQVKKGGVESYFGTIEKKVLGFDYIAKKLFQNAPKDFFKFNQNGLFGVVKLAKSEPFILLESQSFSDIFPEMMAWEDRMFYDLHGFFGLELGGKNNLLINKRFEDGFVQNKNARILYQEDGTIAFMYIYVDDKFVIITSSVQGAHEVMRRLSASEIRK